MRCRKKLTDAQALVKKRWRDKNPTYTSPNAAKNRYNTIDKLLQKRYGITQEQYSQMLVAQDSRCKICAAPNGTHGRRLAIDHCHTTGEIRGLLCMNCNQGLGKFKDDLQLLDKAKDYLSAFKITGS